MWGARTSRYSVPITHHALMRMMQANDVVAIPLLEGRGERVLNMYFRREESASHPDSFLLTFIV
jgi:hypothetical protein